MADSTDPSSSFHVGATTEPIAPEEFRPRSRWWRFSRPCYDKFWRCPGWNGGGPRYAKVIRCRGGRITYPSAEYGHRGASWRLGRCSECTVLVWPLWTVCLSPWEVHRKVRSRISMLDVKVVRCLDNLAAWVLDIADNIERRI